MDDDKEPCLWSERERKIRKEVSGIYLFVIYTDYCAFPTKPRGVVGQSAAAAVVAAVAKHNHRFCCPDSVHYVCGKRMGDWRLRLIASYKEHLPFHVPPSSFGLWMVDGWNWPWLLHYAFCGRGRHTSERTGAICTEILLFFLIIAIARLIGSPGAMQRTKLCHD